MDESSIKYLRIRKWGKWIRPLCMHIFFWKNKHWGSFEAEAMLFSYNKYIGNSQRRGEWVSFFWKRNEYHITFQLKCIDFVQFCEIFSSLCILCVINWMYLLFCKQQLAAGSRQKPSLPLSRFNIHIYICMYIVWHPNESD